MPTPRLAVLISGGGTTLQNLLDRIAQGKLDAQIPLVIFSRASAKGVDRATKASVPVLIETPQNRTRSELSDAIFAHCRDHDVHFVILGGFLHLLEIPPDFEHRVINIHPSLIPAFCGEGFFGHHVHQTAIDRGVKISGCTVHFCDNQYDHGPIILQATVPVHDNDTAQTLAQRVFEAECEALPQAIELVSQHHVTVQNGRVLIDR